MKAEGMQRVLPCGPVIRKAGLDGSQAV